MRPVKEALTQHGAWLVAVAYVVIHLLFPPRAYNSHAIMYALIASAKSHNTLEWFHPLYPPMLVFLQEARAFLGYSGAPLAAAQRLSLLGAAVHLLLLHRVARRAGADSLTALGAVVIATATINLWAWSMQTISYTWATALVLFTVERSLALKISTARDCAILGVSVGLAACFDTAAGLVALAVVADAGPRLPAGRGWRLSGMFLAAIMVTLALGYAPLLLKLTRLGYEFPLGAGQFLDRLPSDVVSLMQSGSLGAQWRRWRTSTAPVDFPFALLAAFQAALWWGLRSPAVAEQEKRLYRMNLWLFASLVIFFFICDPHNRFVYSCALLVPVTAALWLARAGKLGVGVPTVCLLLICWNHAARADYMPERNAGLDEAGYVSANLGRSDLLVSVSQPDWLFSYAVRDRVPVVQILWPEDANTAFAHRLISVGPELTEAIQSVLCDGHHVWLASDSLFRSSLIPDDTMEKDLGKILSTLRGRLKLGSTLVSPAGQVYYPIEMERNQVCARKDRTR